MLALSWSPAPTRPAPSTAPADLFDELGRRFSLAFEKSLPALAHINAVWAYQYAIALGTQMLVRTERANRLAGNSHAAGLDQKDRITFQLLSSGILDIDGTAAQDPQEDAAPPGAGAKKAKTKATAYLAKMPRDRQVPSGSVPQARIS